jgi:hypothetical protein
LIAASWIKLVERWFALLTQKQLPRGVGSTHALKAAILEHIACLVLVARLGCVGGSGGCV